LGAGAGPSGLAATTPEVFVEIDDGGPGCPARPPLGTVEWEPCLGSDGEAVRHHGRHAVLTEVRDPSARQVRAAGSETRPRCSVPNPPGAAYGSQPRMMPFRARMDSMTSVRTSNRNCVALASGVPVGIGAAS